MVNDPYRGSNPQAPVPPPRIRKPFLWDFRVWWNKSRVTTESGQSWNITFDDTQGERHCYKLPWTDNTIERVAVICENTPPGEPAALTYYRHGSYKDFRTAPATIEGVDFIEPTQVPTVARLARQAWDSYQRSNITPTSR